MMGCSLTLKPYILFGKFNLATSKRCVISGKYFYHKMIAAKIKGTYWPRIAAVNLKSQTRTWLWRYYITDQVINQRQIQINHNSMN